MNKAVFEALVEAARASEPVALGVITAVKGSSPQKVGAKAIFYADGRICGTMGGGCLEAEIQQRAVRSLRTGEPAEFELVLDHDFGWDDGLICGGKVVGVILPNAQTAGEGFWRELAERKSHTTWGVTADFRVQPAGQADANPSACPEREAAADEMLAPPGPGSGPETASRWRYLETVSPACQLWIAGAGHIGQAVAPLASQLDFDVTVFDDRPALASHNFFPATVRVRSKEWGKLLDLEPANSPAFALIVTRGHRHDALVLESWVKKPFLFIGMIGSQRKARSIFEHFVEEKLATPEQMTRVACPVGIKIRSRSVMEIAVSIMAQFIDKRAELVYGVHSPQSVAHSPESTSSEVMR